jgi:tetratricopeptide (TPR) repeat protein
VVIYFEKSMCREISLKYPGVKAFNGKDVRMRVIAITIFLLCFICGSSTIKATGFPVFKTPANNLLYSSSGDTSRVNNLARLGLSYVSKPATAGKVKAYLDSAEAVCESMNIESPPLVHLLRAEYMFATNNFNKSYEEATLAVEKARKEGENSVFATTVLFLGKYSLRTGLFTESLDYFIKSIDIAAHYGLKGIATRGYEGQSQVYSALGKIKDYQKTLRAMIDAAIAENDKFYLVTGYFRLGSSYLDMDHNFRLADSLLKKCTEISIKTSDTTFITSSLANTGWNFYLEKSYDSSLYYYKRSLKYSVAGNRYGSSANSFGNIGTIYRDLGNKELALKNYSLAIDQAKKINDWYNLSWVYKDMSYMFLQERDTSKAYNAFVSFKQFSDSSILIKSMQGLSDARVRYEAETHNKEIELLSLKLKNQRILNYGISGSLFLLLAIVLLIFSRVKSNAGRRISEMKRKISEITQANLRQQMNPHFIFNTLNSIQYYMYQHDKLATNIYLTKFSSLMRKVLENSQHTSVPLADELDALNLYLELESLRFKDKFDYEIKIDEDIDTLMYKVPAMLIQPFVENSITHGLIPKEGKGTIKIDLKLEMDKIICTIEDNGSGREAALERKKLRNDNHNSLGTQIVSSRLDLVSALYGTNLKTIYTDLKDEKGLPSGTRVELHIPVIV